MSAGEFEVARYASDSGELYNVRVQPETLLLNVGGVNASAGATATAEPSAQVGASRRSLGVHCRGVRVRFTAGAPTGYAAGTTFFLPVMTTAVFNAINKFDTGSYLGGTVEVVSKVPERIN